MATSSTNTWRRSQETTLKDVVDDVSSSQKYHVESVVIVAVAFRKDATYPGCTLCRRRVHLREIGFTCVSHGAQQDAPIYRYRVRVLLSQPAHPGQELWVTLWDEQMRCFVEFDADVFNHLSTDEKAQTLQHLKGTRVRVDLTKETCGKYTSYNVTDLTVL